ncbi:MAG: RNA ligase, Rnl2 family [Saprospiraceae bacterium]|nr:RNA ligase, Rnl2 family [Saprospiraceae bacterium]
MLFRKYNSIENTYQTRFLERVEREGLAEGTFVVQEKVHGSNLSFLSEDGQHFMSAKRSGLLQSDEHFYNHQLLMDRHLSTLQLLWQLIEADGYELTRLQVYGEVFGGSYPHPEVDTVKQAMKVQKGVFYAPGNHFYAFDIVINGEQYLNMDVVEKYLAKAGFFYAKPLLKGTLQECLAYANAFQTTIPDLLGLPPIADNICEGVVIKPVESCFLKSGARVVLKNKNEKWSEKKQATRKVRKSVTLPEHVLELREEMLCYVTENRLNNVLSKIGEVSMKDFGKVLGLFNKDILEDFEKDNQEALAALDKKEHKMLTKSLGKFTPKLVNTTLRAR